MELITIRVKIIFGEVKMKKWGQVRKLLVESLVSIRESKLRTIGKGRVLSTKFRKVR